MNRPCVHSLYNVSLPREANRQPSQVLYESHHYSKNDLLSKSNRFNTFGKLTQRRVNFASDVEDRPTQTRCSPNHESHSVQANRSPPIPIIKQGKPKVEEPITTIQYANQEAIFSHKKSEQLDSTKCDLLKFDELCSNQANKSDNPLESETVTMSSKCGQVDPLNLADNKDSLIDLFINECFSTNSIDELSQTAIETTVDLNQEAARLAIDSRGVNSKSAIIDDKVYEEIDEKVTQAVKENLKTDILREFDLCYSLHQSSEENKTAIDDSNQISSTSNTTWPLKERKSTYDYDALKFDKNFLIKEAALGIASLETNISGSVVSIGEMDLSKYFNELS